MHNIAISLFLWLLAIPLGAQWLDFPTPGIPRTADGKPTLDLARAPHARGEARSLRPVAAGSKTRHFQAKQWRRGPTRAE